MMSRTSFLSCFVSVGKGILVEEAGLRAEKGMRGKGKKMSDLFDGNLDVDTCRVRRRGKGWSKDGKVP